MLGEETHINFYDTPSMKTFVQFLSDLMNQLGLIVNIFNLEVL